MRVPPNNGPNINTWDGRDRFSAPPLNYDVVRTPSNGTVPVADHPVSLEMQLNAPRPQTLYTNVDVLYAAMGD